MLEQKLVFSGLPGSPILPIDSGSGADRSRYDSPKLILSLRDFFLRKKYFNHPSQQPTLSLLYFPLPRFSKDSLILYVLAVYIWEAYAWVAVFVGWYAVIYPQVHSSRISYHLGFGFGLSSCIVCTLDATSRRTYLVMANAETPQSGWGWDCMHATSCGWMDSMDSCQPCIAVLNKTRCQWKIAFGGRGAGIHLCQKSLSWF